MSVINSLFLKACLLAAFLFFQLQQQATAQNKSATAFDKSISFTSENDSYLFTKADRYYTNGIFLKYRKTGLKNGKKNIRQLELAQMLFTPKRKFDENDLQYFNNGYPINTIDRPFSSYLYVKYFNQRFFSTNKMYQWGISAGTIGKASGGEQTQKLVHRILGLYIPVGWENQLQHNFLLNLQGIYTQQLVSKNIGTSQFKVIPAAAINLGNAHVDGKLLCNVAFGIIDQFENSALLNAEIVGSGTEKKNYELFLYFQPQVTVQAYNATIQNNLFNKSDALTTTLKTAIYEHRIAAVFSQKRMTYNFGYVFQTKELQMQQINHRYASLQFSYKFN